MLEIFAGPAPSWLRANSYLILPLLLACWMAWGDVQSRRIPNYLTLFTILSGLGFQFGVQGWTGVGQGLLGLGVGFILMMPFHLMGGMGAGDVKALAALGAWLGPMGTLFLFIYMGLSGIPLIFFFLWRRGELKARAQRWWAALAAWISLPFNPPLPAKPAAPSPSPGLPYAVAMALGMALLCFRGV
jgi:prepilin peptidase CpaA